MTCLVATFNFGIFGILDMQEAGGTGGITDTNWYLTTFQLKIMSGQQGTQSKT